MQVKKLAILLAAASLATALLTGCPWDKDDAASSDLPGSSSGSTSRPDYDGTSDDENTGKPGGEEDNPGEGGEGDEGETGQPQDSYDEATKTYTVASEDGLREFASMVNERKTDVDCKLECDITLSGDWTPVGNSSDTAYTGKFDGQGHTVSGLTVKTPDETCVGMFGRVGKNGTVQNLNLVNVSISGSSSVGGVAGNNEGTITGCMVSGSVSGNDCVGGVEGLNDGTITGCMVSEGSVTASASRKTAGGIAGYNSGAITGYMVSEGSVAATGEQAHAGGVAGDNEGTVKGCCFAGGSVTGFCAGGVVGMNHKTITDCYWKKGPDTAAGNGSGADACKPIGEGGVPLSEAIAAMNQALAGEGCLYRFNLGANGPEIVPADSLTNILQMFL